MRVVDLARACGSHDRRLTARALGAPRLPTRQPRRWCAWPGSGREPTTLWPRLIEFGHRIGSVPPRRNRRTVRSGRLRWRRRSLHNGPSITASQLRQRAEAVKSLPRRRPGPTRTCSGRPRTGCLLCPLSSAETRHLVSPTNKGRGGIDAMIVQRWERSPETSVNILSYADFHQHDRSFVWGCPGLESGVDLTIGHKGNSGIPLAVAPPPPLHET